MVSDDLKEWSKLAISYCDKKFVMYSTMWTIEKILCNTNEFPPHIIEKISVILAECVKKELGE